MVAMCAYRGFLASAASALSAAIETPSSALAPSRLFAGVPSSAIIASSSARSESNGWPMTARAISPLT